MGNYDTSATTLGNFGRKRQTGEPGVTEIKHPAKYSKTVWLAIYRDVAKLVNMHPEKHVWNVLDPFGGVGGIFDLHALSMEYDASEVDFKITCVEIEREWADQAPMHDRYRQLNDNMLAMDFFDFAHHPSAHESFDIIITSPTYGNRMADHHEAKDDSVRNTYRHKLGRPLSEGSSAGLQWGDAYRDFHRAAWDEVFELLKPGGYFILNVKDHIRKEVKQPVASWHRAYCQSIGFTKVEETRVPVQGNRQGENGEARVSHEHVYVFRKPYTVSIDDMTAAEHAQQSILKGQGIV